MNWGLRCVRVLGDDGFFGRVVKEEMKSHRRKGAGLERTIHEVCKIFLLRGGIGQRSQGIENPWDGELVGDGILRGYNFE